MEYYLKNKKLYAYDVDSGILLSLEGKKWDLSAINYQQLIHEHDDVQQISKQESESYIDKNPKDFIKEMNDFF